MTTKELADVLKSAQTATTLSNLSVPCVNSSGTLMLSKQVTPNPSAPICEDADLATPGWMRTSNSTLNLPAGIMKNGGFLQTLFFDTAAKHQYFYCWTNPPSQYGRKRSSGTSNDKWEDWAKLM